MKNYKIKGLAVCTAVAIILAGNITANAAGGTSTVTVNIPVKTDYTMTIPTTTSVTGYGTTELKNGLKISGTLADGDAIEVSISSQNGDNFKFVNEDKSRGIPYTLKNLSWTSESATDNTITVQRKWLDKTIRLGIYVSQDDWNAVPGGTYSDVLIFTATTVTDRD